MKEDTSTIASALDLRRSHTLSTLLVDQIEELIFSGELGGGTQVNEVALAKQFGVSRGPVREALRLLANDGLVSFIANRGAYVREIDEPDMLEIYDLRAVLTGHACALAAEHADPSDLKEARDLLRSMDKATKSRDAEAYYDLNLQFHDLLMRMAGSGRLGRSYGSLVKESHLFRRVSLKNLTDMSESNADHEAIVAAIEARDPVAARACGEAHVIAGKRRFQSALGAQADAETLED